MTNELVILDEKTLALPEKLFTPEGIDQILKDIKARAKEFEPDMTTEKGRKAIASMAYQISRTKTFLDEKGLTLTAGWAAQKKLVDLERNKVKSTLDDLRDEIRAPLNEWEDLNEKRINERKERIESLANGKNFSSEHSLEVIQNVIKDLNVLIDFDWQEFSFKAKTTFDESMAHLVKIEAQVKIHLAEKEELDKLRKEKEERDQKDREDKIAKDAADKAKADAAELATKEKARVENEKLEAIAAAEKAKDAAAAAAKAREDKIEADKKAAIQAKDDAEQRAVAAKNKAKIVAAQAVTAERQKVEAKKLADAKAAAAREADKKHHAKINNEAVKEISQSLSIARVDASYHETISKAIVTAIANGKIPHVSIKY